MIHISLNMFGYFTPRLFEHTSREEKMEVQSLGSVFEGLIEPAAKDFFAHKSK